MFKDGLSYLILNVFLGLTSTVSPGVMCENCLTQHVLKQKLIFFFLFKKLIVWTDRSKRSFERIIKIIWKLTIKNREIQAHRKMSSKMYSTFLASDNQLWILFTVPLKYWSIHLDTNTKLIAIWFLIWELLATCKLEVGIKFHKPVF